MLRGQHMFVHEEGLAPVAGALLPRISCSSASHFPPFIKQTSMEEIHTDGFISCCYQPSSNLLFPNELVQKFEKCLPQAFIIESNMLNQKEYSFYP